MVILRTLNETSGWKFRELWKETLRIPVVSSQNSTWESIDFGLNTLRAAYTFQAFKNLVKLQVAILQKSKF